MVFLKDIFIDGSKALWSLCLLLYVSLTQNKSCLVFEKIRFEKKSADKKKNMQNYQACMMCAMLSGRLSGGGGGGGG